MGRDGGWKGSRDLPPSGQAATAGEKRPRAERTERTSLISLFFFFFLLIRKWRRKKEKKKQAPAQTVIIGLPSSTGVDHRRCFAIGTRARVRCVEPGACSSLNHCCCCCRATRRVKGGDGQRKRGREGRKEGGRRRRERGCGVSRCTAPASTLGLAEWCAAHPIGGTPQCTTGRTERVQRRGIKIALQTLCPVFCGGCCTHEANRPSPSAQVDVAGCL